MADRRFAAVSIARSIAARSAPVGASGAITSRAPARERRLEESADGSAMITTLISGRSVSRAAPAPSADSGERSGPMATTVVRHAA